MIRFKDAISQFLGMGRLEKYGKEIDPATSPWTLGPNDDELDGGDRNEETVAPDHEGTLPKSIDESTSSEPPGSPVDEEREIELLKWQFELLVNAVDEDLRLQGRPENEEGIALHFFRSRQDFLRRGSSPL